MSQATINKMIRFATLDQRRKSLKKEVKELDEEIAGMTAGLLEAMADDLIAEATVVLPTGEHAVVSTSRQLWASAKEHHREVGEELEGMGMGEFITHNVNGTRLSAWVRDFEEEAGRRLNPNEIDELLPEGLRGKITISEVHKLKSR